MKKKGYGLPLLITVILLVTFGLIMIYSASSIWAEYKFQDSFHYVKQQALFTVIGFIIMYIVSKIDYNIYFKKANIILGICFLLLILVLIPGIGSIRNGSRSWFGIGPFGIQPSEFIKLALIIFTSKYLVNSNKFLKSYKKGVIPILGIACLAFGLIMLQPDLGTGLVLMVSIIALLFIAGVNMKFFYILGVIGVIGVVILIAIAPYRMDRITSFLDPWSDPLGTGFQIIQSLYAIGPGGLLGTGFLNSRQKHFYLPEPQTDFIFSIICEEFGVVGALLIAFLFFLLLYFGVKIALKSNDLFAKYLAFGLVFQMLFQALMNLAVVIGLIPVTGYAKKWEKKENDVKPFINKGINEILLK